MKLCISCYLKEFLKDDQLKSRTLREKIEEYWLNEPKLDTFLFQIFHRKRKGPLFKAHLIFSIQNRKLINAV